MSIQRIVQLTAYDGSLHHFSDQPFAEGKSYRFPTVAVAAQFVERFKLSNLADIEEIARWLGVQPTVGVYREKCTFADYVTPFSDALTNNRLHVVQIASVNPAGVKPSAPVPAPKVQAAKPAADGKSAQQESQDSVSQEPQAESSRNHETAGDPVSMVTGEEILTLCDVANHPVPFSRTYRSSRCDSDSGIGFGWRHSFDLQLFDVQAEDGEVSHWQFVDEMGDTILFPAVNQGAVSYQTYVGASCFYQNDKYRLVTLKNGVQYKFEHVDEHWLLRQIRPSVLQRVELNYSLKHRLIGVSTNQHPSLEFQYDQRGHLIEVREPHSGRVLAQYRYDPQDCLIAATNQQAQTEQYAYSQSHLIIRRQRCTGFTHYFEWTGEGSAAKCVRNYGDDQTYDYCFAYQDDRSSFRDTLGNQWLFLHSAQGKLLEKHSPEGRKWRWDYDHLGRVVAEHFPDGSCVSFQYNQYGQKIAQQHTSGAITRYQYNQLGQQTMLLHPDGEKQYQHYNSLGQLLWRSATDGTVTEYQYDKFGRLIQSHSARGEKQQWWWNDNQQLVARQINQTLLRYSYDQHNDLDGIAYPDEMVVAFERDSHGQVVKTKAFNSKDDTQREVSYQYDDFGRLTQITTPAGRSVIEWGKLAQPEAIIRADGSALAFEYDGERNLTAITRSDGVQYHLTLSADGHLAQITNFDGICTQYDYDAAGRLAHLRCAERQVAFDYDLNGNLCRVRAGGKYGLCENHFQFSAGSKLRLASNAKRTIQNLYQSDGLLSEQTQGNHTFVYRYNACGQLAEIELPDGETMILAYTAYGQLQRVQRKECQTEAVQYEYDEMGRICRLYCGGQSEERQFDGIGRLNLQRWPEKTRKYHYDAAQHLAIVIDSESGATHYQYDALGQLTRAKSVYVEEKYHFDGFGHPQGQASQRLGDRLLEHQGWRFQYDAHGNQIKAEGQGQEQSRRFNALNQLVEVQCDDQLAYYEYDALGRRSRKVTEAGVTEFLWQESQLIGEYHQGRYRWYFYQPESHIPSMLVQDGQCYFYQCDHLGTPLRLVTSQGEIVWQAHYETWGTAHIEIEQVTNPLRFQGQYYDVETGLHYNLARYYDPRAGRFIQPDPIGLLGGLNHYQYAPNPVMWVDPTGLCAKEDRPAITAGANDVEPQQQIFYAMGSGNYSSTLKTSSPTYQLNAGMSDVNQVNSDDIHLFLDGAGMMPAFGIIPDLANTLLYAAEGDYANALISAMAMVPIAGQGATAAKYGNKALNAATETAAKGSDNLTSAAKQLDGPKGGELPKSAHLKRLRNPVLEKHYQNLAEYETRYQKKLDDAIANGASARKIGAYKAKLTEVKGERAASAYMEKHFAKPPPPAQMELGFGPGPGVDQIWAKRDENGKVLEYFIVEAKGPGAKLQETKTKGMQMSNKWIENNLNRMKKSKKYPERNQLGKDMLKAIERDYPQINKLVIEAIEDKGKVVGGKLQPLPKEG